MSTDNDESEHYNEMAEEHINGLKKGWKMAADYSQYSESDWEREKQIRIEYYQEKAKANEPGKDKASRFSVDAHG